MPLWVYWICASVDKNLTSHKALQLLYPLKLSIKIKTKNFTMYSCWHFLTYANLTSFILLNSCHHITMLISSQSSGVPRCSISSGNFRCVSGRSLSELHSILGHLGLSVSLQIFYIPITWGVKVWLVSESLADRNVDPPSG